MINVWLLPPVGGPLSEGTNTNREFTAHPHNQIIVKWVQITKDIISTAQDSLRWEALGGRVLRVVLAHNLENTTRKADNLEGHKPEETQPRRDTT